jgi:tetratricopeptide (TPR) repeat protein
MTVRLACIAVLIGSFTATSLALDPWEYRTNAGEYAYATGDLVRAEAEFRAALELAQGFPPGDRRLERSLENLAGLYENQRRLDEAQPLYQLLLAAQETRVGHDSPELLDTHLKVARVSLSAGDSPAAGASLERYLEIADSSGAAAPAQHWLVLSMLARMRTLEQRPEEALELQRRAVEVLADDGSATGLERAHELESLAQMELLHGFPERAEELLTHALELRAEDGGSPPTETYAAAATTALGAGEFDLAERLAERAVEAAGDPPPLDALEVLAEVSWHGVGAGGSPADILGAGGDSEKLRIAAIRLEALAAHPSLSAAGAQPERSQTYARLATVAALRGDADSAASWKRRQLEEVESLGALPGGGSRGALEIRLELVPLLQAAGRLDEAVTENGLLIEALEATYGTDDAKLSLPLQRQVDLLTDLGRKKEAKALKKRLRQFERGRR